MANSQQKRSPNLPPKAFTYKAEFSHSFKQITEVEHLRLAKFLPDQELQTLVQSNNPHLDFRYLPLNTKARLAADIVRRRPSEFALYYFRAVSESAKSVLTKSEYENPNWEQFSRALVVISNDWSENLVRCWLYAMACETDLPACEHAQRYLAEHTASLTDSPEPSTDADAIEDYFKNDAASTALDSQPGNDEIVYTPLTKAIIQLILESATEQEGSPKRNEIEAILIELMTSNSAKDNYWFLAGFASGLHLVEQDWALDFAAVNDQRRAWQLGGCLFGLLRQKAVNADEIRQTLVSRDSDLQNMYDTPFMPSLARFIIRFQLELDVDRVEEMLAKIPLPGLVNLDRYIQLLEEVDTQSVLLLRRNLAVEAATVLRTSLDRLEQLQMRLDEELRNHWLRDSLLRHLTDLEVRMRLGLAASSRIRGNYGEAKSQLNLVSEEKIGMTETRTHARFYFQRALALSGTSRIENQHLPRNEEETRQFRARYQAVEQDLLLATELPFMSGETYNTRYDALYVLAGLAMADEDWELARNRVDEVAARYESRPERKYLIDEIRWIQTLLDLRRKGETTASLALVELCESLPPKIVLRENEVSLALDVAVTTGVNELPRLIEWLSSDSQRRHAAPSDVSVRKALERFPNHLAGLLPLAQRVSPLNVRVRLLFSFLDEALLRQDSAEIENVIDAIEQVLQQGSNAVWEAWGDYISQSESLTAHLGGWYAANNVAIACYRNANSEAKQREAFERAIEGLLPVQTLHDQARLQILLDEFESIDSGLAKLYRDDQSSKPLQPYVPFVASAEAAQNSVAPVRVLFVGGTAEEQGRRENDIVAKINQNFGKQVEVKFVYPGFGTYTDTLNQVKRDLEAYEVLVLMPLVRTTFGRHVRRVVDTQRRPWVACTGNGVASMVNAISEAVNVANALRPQSQ